MQKKVKKISSEEGDALIDRYIQGTMNDEDYGKFYCIEPDGRVVAIDNDTGDCWVEDFGSVSGARHWLLKYY